MANLGRRMALKKLGMGAMAAPMMPAALADAAVRGGSLGVSGAVSGGLATAQAVAEWRPWQKVGLVKEAWDALAREKREREARDSFTRLANLGVIEGDIQALYSLSHAAKVRMQVDREIGRRREHYDWSKRLFGDDD